MTEQLLQFIWRYQYFNRGELATTSGEELMVVRPGIINRDQGPDFLDAVLLVDNIRWNGSIELHLRTTDWRRHRHQGDPNYTSVILHVVWHHDEEVNDRPVLELYERIPGLLLSRYERLMMNQAFIPCDANTRHITSLGWISWKDRLLFERMERKAAMIGLFNRANGGQWPGTIWWLLARAFGAKVNADAFEQLARSIPWPVVVACRPRYGWLEALLLGQAGLLDQAGPNARTSSLWRRYRWLQEKYALLPVRFQMRHLRMRPNNFPQLRLAQLAMLLAHTADPCQLLCGSTSLNELRAQLKLNLSGNWREHPRSGTAANEFAGRVGDFMINNLVINVAIPLMFRIGYHDPVSAELAIAWLQQLRRENNALTDHFEEIGFLQDNAFDSQAMLELKSQYCDQRRCLECAVGYSILNPRRPNQS